MSPVLPEIISLTTMCSAGCSHCPYSNSELPKLFLKTSSINHIANTTSSSLIILTGGEPLQHPELTNILINLSNNHTPFRLATGGFINLNPWIDLFHSLHEKRIFQGVSLGTDVISQRVSSSKWVKTWILNIQLLQMHNVPYSLTMTIDPHLDFKWFDLWQWKRFNKGKPEFIYLRYLDEKRKKLWIQKIIKTFDALPIIEDHLSYLCDASA